MEKPPPTTVDLPPGFRFHPTDEEIVTYYLTPKIINSAFAAAAIGEADLNKTEPWDLPQKAKMGEKEWYFFCQRDRKYPTGMRTNRATQTGYWKATGKDREIFEGKTVLAGMKKTLVFYKGRAPKGEKTNWVMHEFRLEPKFSHHLRLPKATKKEWVVCRVFHKNTTMTTMEIKRAQISDFSSSLPPLLDLSAARFPNSDKFNNGGEKWRSPEPSEYDLKYMSNNIGVSSPHYQQPTTSSTSTMIPTLNSYPTPVLDDDGFFSFNQLPSNGTKMAMATTTPMECKMEQVSWSMMNGTMQDVSSSVDNDSFAASMVDLDMWDY